MELFILDLLKIGMRANNFIVRELYPNRRNDVFSQTYAPWGYLLKM